MSVFFSQSFLSFLVITSCLPNLDVCLSFTFNSQPFLALPTMHTPLNPLPPSAYSPQPSSSLCILPSTLFLPPPPPPPPPFLLLFLPPSSYSCLSSLHTEREVFSKQSLKFSDFHKLSEKARGKQKRRERALRPKSSAGQKLVGSAVHTPAHCHTEILFRLKTQLQVTIVRELVSPLILYSYMY